MPEEIEYKEPPTDTDYKTVTKDGLILLTEELKSNITNIRDGNLSKIDTLYLLVDLLQILINQNKEETTLLADHEIRIQALEV